MPLGHDACVDWVDPFIGTEATHLPPPEGIAATWFFLKAQIGNTHPGACLPFGPVSACPYSGAYVTGYGRYDINTHGTPPRLYDRTGAYGVTHVHHSGTGYIESFYNYLLTMPYRGSTPAVPAVDLLRSRPYPLSRERARPGFYAGTLEGIEVDLELAAGRQTAAHRYVFRRSRDDGAAAPGPDAGIAVDITNAGLAPRRAQARAEALSAAVHANGICTGRVVHCGVTWYFALVCPRCAETVLWKGQADGSEAAPASGLIPSLHVPVGTLDMDGAECRQRRAGAAFRAADGAPMLLYVGLSLASEASALRAAEKAEARGFDGIASDAESTWEELLGTIRVHGGDDRRRRVFYTALYHSFLKPVETEPDNFVWKNGPPLYADFATLWDQYKTQLPLVFTLQPQRIGPIVRSLVHLEATIGAFPPLVLLSTDHDRCREQSRALAHVVLKDAFDRTDADIRRDQDWDGVLDAMTRSLEAESGRTRPGQDVQAWSHLLDLAYGAFCTAALAAELRRTDVVHSSASRAGAWRDAFDAATGMMKQGEYYEAGNVSYSFRLLHDMASRIALAGGRAAFRERLDTYFGYGAEPVAQLRDPPWDLPRKAGLALGRFDGVNNEVALEAPYAYGYAGMPDRTAEIVDAVMRCEFSDSRGGLPGNDDSGALSSWYVWNALGLFPVPGQGVFFIGSPAFEGADVTIGRRRFRIRAMRQHGHAIYVGAVRLNGLPLRRSFLRYAEVLSGGELELDLVDEPGTFDPEEVPPSYPLGYPGQESFGQ